MLRGAKVRVNVFETRMIRRILRGENEVLYQLVRPYATAVFSTARGILHYESDAEDVAQEVFLKAFTNLADFRGEARFSTWLTQITINQALMRVRQAHRQVVYSLDNVYRNTRGDYISRDFADWRDIPSEVVQRKELRHALSRALGSLTPKYKEVLVMRDVRHFSIAKTADMLGVTKSAVKTRLLRARLQMREALGQSAEGYWNTWRSEFSQVR